MLGKFAEEKNERLTVSLPLIYCVEAAAGIADCCYNVDLHQPLGVCYKVPSPRFNPSPVSVVGQSQHTFVYVDNLQVLFEGVDVGPCSILPLKQFVLFVLIGGHYANLSVGHTQFVSKIAAQTSSRDSKTSFLFEVHLYA